MSCLSVKGRIIGKKAGVFQGKPYCSLQFTGEGQGEEAQFVEVALPDDADHTPFKKGMEVELPVTVRARDGRLYFRAILPNSTGNARPTQAKL